MTVHWKWSSGTQRTRTFALPAPALGSLRFQQGRDHDSRPVDTACYDDANLRQYPKQSLTALRDLIHNLIGILCHRATR